MKREQTLPADRKENLDLPKQTQPADGPDLSIQAVWIDVDQTLLNFDAGARQGMIKAFEACHLPWDEKYYAIFLKENAKLWDRIESGELDRDKMRKIRFPIMFKAFGLPLDDPEGFEQIFTREMYNTAIPMEGALDAMKTIESMHLPLFVATNGHKEGQSNRLLKAGLRDFFEDIFASSDYHAAKPDSRFFQKALEQTSQILSKELRAENILVIGDSWKADIVGAIQFGCPSIWYRQNRKDDPFQPDHQGKTIPADSWQEVLDALVKMVKPSSQS